MRPQRVEPVCIARLVAELDLESIVRENLDNCTDLTGDKAHLGQIADESHGVEQMDVRSSRHIEALIG